MSRTARLLALGIASLVVGAAAPSAAAADPNLVGQWHLDQQVDTGDGFITPDSSAAGDNLIVSGPTVINDGRFAGAFRFDGNSYAYTSSAGTTLQPAQLTVMAWVRAAQNPGQYKYLVADGADGNCSPSSYALYTGGSGGLQFYVREGAAAVLSPDAGIGIWDGQWHAVAGVFDGSTVRLYVDGNEVVPGTPGAAPINYALTYSTFTLGNYPYPGCPGYDYAGDLDETRVYDAALTPAEINYLQTAPGSTPPALPNAGPSVATGQADSLTPSSATLHGSVAPQGEDVSGCHFEYGPSTAYGSSIPCAQAAGSGAQSVPVSASISNLTPGATYDFRLVATNAHGTTTGANATFTTPTGLNANFSVVGRAKTIKGGMWFNGSLSHLAQGVHIVDYAWDTNGDGKYDWNCGKSPFAVIAFLNAGNHTVGLKVTDSLGHASFTKQRFSVSSLLTKAHLATPVFDCENPVAGGNQPDRADCVKSFGYGIIDANSRGQPGDCFQLTSRFNPNALQFIPRPIAGSSADLPPRATAAFRRNPFLVYHATLKGPVAINGLYLPLPEANQSEYDTSDQSFTLGRVNLQIGKFLTQSITLGHVSAVPNQQGIAHVDDLTLKGANAALGALPIKGSISVDLMFHVSRTRFHLSLPPPFSFSPSTPAQGDVYLISDNVNGVRLDGVRLGPFDTWIGPVYVKNLSFRYIQSQNLWDGGADIFLPGSPVGLNAAQPPPDAGFGLKNGRFDHAGVGLDFIPPAQPELFPGIFLTNVHVAIGLHPLRFTGGGAISVGEVLAINGDLFVAFASPDQPYDFPTDAATGDLAPLAGRTFDSFTIAIGGNASLTFPFFGQVGIANAHALYEYPDFVEVGADYGLDLGLVKFSGTLNGFVLASAGQFSFDSQVSACPNFKVKLPIVGTQTIDKPCFGAGVAISTVGVGLCGTVPIPFFTGAVPVTITVGYKWGDGVDVALFSCDLGPYELANPRAAATGTPQSFTLKSGLPSAMVRIDGSGASPDVTLTGPGGKVIDTANPPQDPNVVVLVQGNNTLVALKHPAGGRWTVAADSGSAPITSVAFAGGLPSPQIKVRVSGRGTHRTLRYQLKPSAGRRIVFAERGARTYHLIGAATRARGQIKFAPAGGRRERRVILALIYENGVRMRSLVVGHYAAPGPARPGRVTGLRTSHKGSTLTASWRRAAGVSAYDVIVLESDSEHVLRLTTKRSIRIGGVPGRLHGTVLVQAVGQGAIRGPAVRRSFAAVRRARR